MNETLEKLERDTVALARTLMEAMDSWERHEFFDKITEGYCKHCGMEDPEQRCRCWNDE